MEYEEIYKLSKYFSPPKVDLRKAEILDSYGDESYATLMLSHLKPDDVKREEIDYYGWIYPFMEPEDLLFYLYPLIIEYEKDKALDCFDSFMYSMDNEIKKLQSRLTKTQNETLKQAFQLIWDNGGDEWTDWKSCKNLQQLIGITVE